MAKTYDIQICEVGPRDGFQFEKKPIPTELKIEWIQRLIAAGLPRIQITSFVHPKWVPQMADAEKVVRGLADETCAMSVLALNVKGVERAVDAGARIVDLSIATNEQHGKDNVNMSVQDGIARADEMIDRALEAGISVQLGLQTVWGYRSAGDTSLPTIVNLAERFSGRGLESFSLADSTGMAGPNQIKQVVEAVAEIMDAPLVLHLHDTRGLGLANISAAIEAGVNRFDTSLGGLGGCPFIPGATGNVPTEEVVHLAERQGLPTGIDNKAVATVSRDVAAFLDKELSGKMYRLI